MQLLVSVRSAAEAEAALDGGADLIDVKEPLRGPLGRAEASTVAAVLRGVAGRRPVSAALGELRHEPAPEAVAGLAYVKWGLAGYADATWERDWRAARRRLQGQAPACRVVLAAYADWQQAGAPSVAAVAAFALRHPGSVLLLDTALKQPGRTLLDVLSIAELIELCQRCRGAGVRIALAGSLGPEAIRRLLPARPDWFAVRGAVCHGADRTQIVRADRVRAVADLIASPASAV